MYEVLISHEAGKFYKKQDTNTKQRLNKCIDNLGREPLFGLHIKRLHGELEGKYAMKWVVSGLFMRSISGIILLR